MTTRNEHFLLPDEAAPSVSLSLVKQSVTCAICSDLICSTLVLSCGHQYCGSCLFDWLGNRPSCPSCQVPVRAIPMRCVGLDAIVEAFLTAMPEQEVAAYKARQEEGRSAANKVNKMLWYLQPSAMPGMPQAGPSGFGSAPGAGMAPAGAMLAPKQPPTANPPMPQQVGGGMASGMQGGTYNPAKGPSSQAGSMRRQSQPGHHPSAQQQSSQQGFPPRYGARSNSFSAGGAPHGGMVQQPQTSLPPQMAASIAAAGFPAPGLPLCASNTDADAAYYAAAQNYGMEGFTYPLALQQQVAFQQQLQQQEQFRGLLNACNELHNSEMAAAHQSGSYADPQQLQQLLQGLYFA
ncbi:E3 ubiquitin-protein ligase [Tetrabaena socialis]|uniref:E3 ubiquitin-protein ligase n=1 Tax=Tetrabaena socialis TaxID=47790 RepID=A0A2J8AI34_9CHLO|nr:E3 ubiquitin-protein ligase [Tetrabaena socialis]|eukprot:PNH12170.1 E3 ubiquitin-protein ligase [Tetrabaena socialis]